MNMWSQLGGIDEENCLIFISAQGLEDQKHIDFEPEDLEGAFDASSDQGLVLKSACFEIAQNLQILEKRVIIDF
jgi:hypothetical protein